MQYAHISQATHNYKKTELFLPALFLNSGMTSVSKFYITDDIFQDNDVGRRNKYKCPLCGYLLKEAVQTSCGHWLCQDCGDELFMKRWAYY